MEEIHDLIPDKLKIIQHPNYFKFGTDSVLLANFTVVREGERVVDLGSGSGVIPLLLAFKQNPSQVIGLEIQPELVEMSRRSVVMNGLTDSVIIKEGDLRQAEAYIEPESIDLVVTNPPYVPVNSGKVTRNREVAIARHELYARLEDVIRAGATLLRYGGRLTMVHRSWRLIEIISCLRQYNLEPKRLQVVQSRLHLNPKTILVEARKGARPGLTVEPTLIVYEGDSQEYTETVQRMYSGNYPD